MKSARPTNQFMVGMSPEGKVTEVLIMVFRENAAGK